MDKISAHLKLRVALKGDRRTERGELLKEFFTQLNVGRVQKGFKPLTMARLGVIFQGVPNEDVYAFLKECKRAKNFGAFFNSKVFPKKK